MKLFWMSMLLFSLSAADPALLLPHRWQDARHEITSLLRAASQSVVIVTHAVEDPYVRKALRQAVEKGRHVTLMTSSESTASQWAMYKNVDTCLLPGNSPIDFSLITADGSHSCLVTSSLVTRHLRHDYGLLRCENAEAYGELLEQLRRECRPYFDEK